MKKVVFDLETFKKRLYEVGYDDEGVEQSVESYGLECDGLTEEEMRKKGYGTSPFWMKEIEVKE